MDIFSDVNEVFHRRASRCFRDYKLELRQELAGLVRSEVQRAIRNQELVNRDELERRIHNKIDKRMVGFFGLLQM